MKTNTLYAIAAVLLSAYQAAAKPAEGCLQTYTIVVGDGCDTVASRFKLTDKDFFNMNPGLHHSERHMCDNLDVDKPYCVCMQQPCVTLQEAAANAPPPANTNNGTTNGNGSNPSQQGTAPPSQVITTAQADSIAQSGTATTQAGPTSVLTNATTTPSTSLSATSMPTPSTHTSSSSADHLTSLHQAAVMAAGAATAMMVVFL